MKPHSFFEKIKLLAAKSLLVISIFGFSLSIPGLAQENTKEFITDTTLWITPANRITYTPQLTDTLVFGTKDLGINVEMASTITTCEIKIRRYFSKDKWTDLPATITDKKCQATFSKDLQTQWYYEGVVKVTDKNGQNWLKFIQPVFGQGSFSFIKIQAEIVNNKTV